MPGIVFAACLGEINFAVHPVTLFFILVSSVGITGLQELDS